MGRMSRIGLLINLNETSVKPRAHLDKESQKLSIEGNNFLTKIGEDGDVHLEYKSKLQPKSNKVIDTNIPADSFTSVSIIGSEDRDTIWLDLKGAKKLKNITITTLGANDNIYLKTAPKDSSTEANLGNTMVPYTRKGYFGLIDVLDYRDGGNNSVYLDTSSNHGNVTVKSSEAKVDVFNYSNKRQSLAEVGTLDNQTKTFIYNDKQQGYIKKD